MPRIRQVGQIRQPNGNPNLPDTGPVIVNVGNEPPQQLIYGSSAAQLAAAVSSSPIIDPRSVALDYDAGRIRPEITAPSGDLPFQEDDDALKELRASEKRAKDRTKALEQSQVQLTQWGQQQAEAAATAYKALTETQLDTLTSAVAAAEGEASAAETAYADAMSKGDWLGAAKAQRAMITATSRIETLNAGRQELEQQAKQPAKVAPPPPINNNIEAILATLPNLSDAERDWIREHPDSMSGENVPRMQVAFRDATARNIKRGSKEYFAFFNERLGYDNGRDDPGDGEIEEEPVQPVREQRRVSAPVTRNNTGGPNLRPGQVMLSEAQRQAARMSGVDEVTYARGLQRLIDAKRTGLYPSG